MPTVSESDCTEIELIEQQTTYSYQPGSRPSAIIGYTEVKFNPCRGANGINDDLSAYVQRLVQEGRASRREFYQFQQFVVGKRNCPRAIERFMRSKGWGRVRPVSVDPVELDDSDRGDGVVGSGGAVEIRERDSSMRGIP